jgi:hypothetical protein
MVCKKYCKSCKSENIRLIYHFGLLPPVNSYYKFADFDLLKKYPLELYVCADCWLIQILNIPDPNILFDEYHHLSGSSEGNVEHLKNVALMVNDIKRINGEDKNKILEIGANDGTLLKYLNKLNFDVFGVEPAKNIKPQEKVKIFNGYFNLEFSKKVKKESGKFDYVIGLNVFAHNAEFVDMFAGIKNVLSESGISMIEVAYAPSTIGSGNFDTIYHEHVCSYSLISLENALRIAGLEIYDAYLINTQGGSLRVFCSHLNNSKVKTKNYLNLQKKETLLKLNSLDYYSQISIKIEQKVIAIRKFLHEIMKSNKKLLIVGSPARGVVIINVCDIDLSNFAIVVDDTPQKQEKHMPGTKIKVSSWEKINFSEYNTALILSWNYSDFLSKRLIDKGFVGETFVPLPTLKKISG